MSIWKKKLKELKKRRWLELYVADVIDDHKMKMNAMRLKMDAMHLKLKKIRKYAIDNESWYHYAVGSIVTLVHHICCDEGKFSLIFCFTNGYLAYFPRKWHNNLTKLQNDLFT